jgi:hypothetical protein
MATAPAVQKIDPCLGSVSASQTGGIYLEGSESTSTACDPEPQQAVSEVAELEEPEQGKQRCKDAPENVSKTSLASETDGAKSSKKRQVLTGQVTMTVPEGTPLKLKLATVPTHVMKMMNRDMEGNLYPARLGQEITARTSEDLYVDDNKVIPEGTIFHGSVCKILPPRRVGRPGSFVLSFDYLTTPDGRQFAFKAQADNFKPSTLRTKAKGFGIIAAHAAGGAIVGALVAYQIFGLQYTVQLHGYNIAAGAAGGALLATGYAIMRRGPEATLEPGDDLNMKIDSDLLMPVAVEAREKKRLETIAGVTITLKNGKVIKDGLDGSIYSVDATIRNDSDISLRSIDLYLQDSNGNLCPLETIPEDESESLFTVEPNSSQHRKLSFSLTYPKLQRQLVWLDHNSKKVCYRLPAP